MKPRRWVLRSSMVSSASARRGTISGFCSMRRPEWMSEEMGASELLISWAMTRMVRFQVSASLRRIARVSGLRMKRMWGCMLSWK